MRTEAIFVPVSVLALWTGAVLFMTGVRRVLAVRAGRARRDAFRLGESTDVPASVTVWNRNLMNLLEMPVLFYVACIAIYATRMVTPGVVALAWLYVASRLAHTMIHLTSNGVMQRFAVFALGNVVLLAIWIWFLGRLV